MEIIKIVGIALTAVILIIIIKQHKPEFAVYISVIASILIIFIFMDKLLRIITFISDFSEKINRWRTIPKNTNQNHRNCHSNRICHTGYVTIWVKAQSAQKSI